MMKRILLIVVLFFSIVGSAQNENKYKYVIVSEKFDFQKSPNQYNLNALTKMVFEKLGYEVYFDKDTFPQELAKNRCQGLYADMKESNTMLMTKIKLELRDCNNQVVFVSDEGSSREKEYAKAYLQAFRTVGKSVENFKNIEKEVVVNTEVNENIVSKVETKSEMLFAQPNSNGYQLVDTTPKVVMKLYKTSVVNFYIGQKETVQGVVFSKNNQWFFEYYQNEKLVTEQLEIKF